MILNLSINCRLWRSPICAWKLNEGTFKPKKKTTTLLQFLYQMNMDWKWCVVKKKIEMLVIIFSQFEMLQHHSIRSMCFCSLSFWTRGSNIAHCSDAFDFIWQCKSNWKWKAKNARTLPNPHQRASIYKICA